MATKVYILDNLVILDRDGVIEEKAPIAKASGIDIHKNSSGVAVSVGIIDYPREHTHWIAFTDFQNEAGTAISTETTIRAYLAPLIG